jgi:hypothetical protein
MTDKGNIKLIEPLLATEITEIVDNGGRRSGIDRRKFLYDGHIPERRGRSVRRIALDRRSGLNRRSGRDRRTNAERRKGTLRGTDWGKG